MVSIKKVNLTEGNSIDPATRSL